TKPRLPERLQSGPRPYAAGGDSARRPRTQCLSAERTVESPSLGRSPVARRLERNQTSDRATEANREWDRQVPNSESVRLQPIPSNWLRLWELVDCHCRPGELRLPRRAQYQFALAAQKDAAIRARAHPLVARRPVRAP